VRFKLTGARATDVADASGTLLFDVVNRRWSAEMLEASDLRAEILPEVFESPEITGRVSREGASGQRTARRHAGGGRWWRQAAGAVGMGIVEPGNVSATIGTSGVVFASTSRPVVEPKGRHSYICTRFRVVGTLWV